MQVDEELPDDVNSTKRKRRVVKKEGAMSKSIRDKEKHETDSPEVMKSNKRKREEFKKKAPRQSQIGTRKDMPNATKPMERMALVK